MKSFRLFLIFFMMTVPVFLAAQETAAPAPSAPGPENAPAAEASAPEAAAPAETSPASSATATPAPKAKVRPIRFIFYSGIRYVLLYDVADYYRLAATFTTKGVTLYSKTRRIEMSYTRREGSINGVKTYFLAPVLYLDKKPYITESDFLKVIDPVFRTKLYRKHPLRTIMIDPGHGGSDPGAPGPVLSEKQINLIIGLKLKKALERLGFKVIMTRSGDTFPSLSARSSLCKLRKPDLYISIHCNSAGNRTVKGVETYLMTPTGCASTADKTAGNQSYPGNAFDSNNERLAYEIQKALLKYTTGADRGVRHARFAVLRGATCPAVLVECGFLSNLSEGRKLATNDYQNRIVAGILTGIARYSRAVQK